MISPTTLSTIQHRSTSQTVRFGMNATNAANDTVDLTSRQPSFPIDIYPETIAKCPADALIVNVYRDMFRPHIDPKQREVWNLSGGTEALDNALGGAITEALKRNNKPQTAGSVTVLSRQDGQDAAWKNIQAKHVIVVSLGEYPKLGTSSDEMLNTLKRAHQKALQTIKSDPKLADVQTAATLLHGMDIGPFKSQAGIFLATKALKNDTNRAIHDGAGPLKKLYIATHHASDESYTGWVAEKLGIPAPKMNMPKPPAPKANTEPVQSGLFSRAWNGLKSFFSNIWNGIKRLFGFGKESKTEKQPNNEAASGTVI